MAVDASVIDDLFAPNPAPGPKCWHTRAPKGTEELLAAVQKRFDDGEHPNWAKLHDLLKSRYNFFIVPNSLSRHFHRKCGCWR